MDKSIVSLKHCAIPLFFVPLPIDLLHRPALLMERPTSRSKGFDTMAFVVVSSLRCLSPASVETSYSVRNKISACSVTKLARKSTLSRYSLLHARIHTRDVVSSNKA